MYEKKLHKVEDPDDPRRCQAVIRNQQCPFISVPGTDNCIVHGNPQALLEKKNLRNYRLTKWQNRINDFADNSQIKSLREEIGIVRIILEEIVQSCQDSTDLILYSNKISDLVMKIEKLVSSCHRLEFNTGELLNKTTILNLASIIVEIVSRYIPDQSNLEEIADEITTLILIQNTNKVDSDMSKKITNGVGLESI